MKRCQHAVWGGFYKLASVPITNMADVTGEQSQVQKPDAFAVQANNPGIYLVGSTHTFSVTDGKSCTLTLRSFDAYP